MNATLFFEQLPFLQQPYWNHSPQLEIPGLQYFVLAETTISVRSRTTQVGRPQTILNFNPPPVKPAPPPSRPVKTGAPARKALTPSLFPHVSMVTWVPTARVCFLLDCFPRTNKQTNKQTTTTTTTTILNSCLSLFLLNVVVNTGDHFALSFHVFLDF